MEGAKSNKHWAKWINQREKDDEQQAKSNKQWPKKLTSET